MTLCMTSDSYIAMVKLSESSSRSFSSIMVALLRVPGASFTCHMTT